MNCSLSSIGAFLLVVLSVASGAAVASPANSYWVTNIRESPLIGIVDPEYSEVHIVIFSMECDIPRQTVTLSQDTGASTKPRSTTLPLLINGSPTPLRANPVYMEMDETWALEATLGYGSPQLQKVAAAKSLGLSGDPTTQRLPSKQFQVSMAKWAKACKLK